MNKQSVLLPGPQGMWGSYISKYQPDSNKVLDNMFTSGSKNFITDQTGMIQKRQGGVQWNRTTFSEAARDTYEAVFESGARHFLRVGGGVLSASTGTGLFDVITSGYSPMANFEWVTSQNRVYGCNGVNAPQTYDIATSYGGVSYSFTTAKTKVMGAQAPGSAPTSSTPTAGGSIPVGPHRYKITFEYYSSEESNGSPASAVQTTTSGFQTIALTNIPIGGYGVTARNIYRDNNDGVYVLLDTIPNNTTTTYTDTLFIGSTPTPLPLFNNVPPTFTKIALWLDTIFIAPSGETNTIVFSNAGQPDIFDPGNFVTCQSDDVITALQVYNGKLYVFGLHSFGSIEGNTPDTFFYHNISNIIGCVDNRTVQIRSIVSIPTLWWLSDKGFYYSNGYTVEYGSDYIQDLVNLNIAQVNYAINKNTQSSFADFSGDTRSPGIDIVSNPGTVTTIDPVQTYSSTADWDGGSSLVNIRTGANANFIEVPTLHAPALASGTLINTVINGSVLQTPVVTPFTGESHAWNNTTTQPTVAGFTGANAVADTLANPIIPTRNGTLTEVFIQVQQVTDDIGITKARAQVWSDAGGLPGSVLYTFSPDQLAGGLNQNPIWTGSFALTGGVKYWIVFLGLNSISDVGNEFHFVGVPAGNAEFSGGLAKAKRRNGPNVWGTAYRADNITPLYSVVGGYNYTADPYPTTGAWIGPTYDSHSVDAVAATITETGSFPASTSSSLLVEGANDTNFISGYVSQSFPNLNGTTAVSLSGVRYWRIRDTLSTTDDRVTASVGAPTLTFDTTGTWISQPIDTTTDNTGWGTLTLTGNTPAGTTATLQIATSSDNITYSSYGPIGSALIQRWAKVMLVLTTTSDNITSPSISSVTLTWTLTSTITSSIIDTGTIPAGFSQFQWDQPTTSGTVTFYIRTASTALGIPSATFVLVGNGEFPNLTALEFVQWKAVLMSTVDNVPSLKSITVTWYNNSGRQGVRCSSLFFNKTYYVSVATIGATVNDTLIQLDQFGNWRVQKDASIGTFLSYFNTLYFTDGIVGLIFNGFIANTDNGTPITMDIRTKAWNATNDLFLKVPRAFKVTGLHTGTAIHAYYSADRGATWIEMLNEQGTTGYQTNISGSEFVTLFVPDGSTLIVERTLMFRIVSSDMFPCSILNYMPSFYSRKGRYLNNG